MTEFRRIIVSATVDEAENALEEALNSETACEYEDYQKYLTAWWDRKELWCLEWRTEHHHGPTTSRR